MMYVIPCVCMHANILIISFFVCLLLCAFPTQWWPQHQNWGKKEIFRGKKWKKWALSAQKLLFWPFLYWNHQIWLNFNILIIFFWGGKLVGQLKYFWENVCLWCHHCSHEMRSKVTEAEKMPYSHMLSYIQHNIQLLVRSINPHPPEVCFVTRPPKGVVATPFPGFSIRNTLYPYICYQCIVWTSIHWYQNEYH